MSKVKLISLAFLCCFAVTSCRLTVVLEPLPTPNPERVGNIVGEPQVTPALAPTENLQVLSILKWKYIRYVELGQEDLGNNWIALARPLSRPYKEADLIE